MSGVQVSLADTLAHRHIGSSQPHERDVVVVVVLIVVVVIIIIVSML